MSVTIRVFAGLGVTGLAVTAGFTTRLVSDNTLVESRAASVSTVVAASVGTGYRGTFSQAPSGTLITRLYNGGLGRSTAEFLAHTGLRTPDYLYGFDNPAAPGADSGPNGITLNSRYSTPTTQTTGPG